MLDFTKQKQKSADLVHREAGSSFAELDAPRSRPSEPKRLCQASSRALPMSISPMQRPAQTPMTPHRNRKHKEVAQRQTKKPVSDEVGQHQRSRIARTAQTAGGYDLHPVE